MAFVLVSHPHRLSYSFLDRNRWLQSISHPLEILIDPLLER
jgi:hypothetical protein